MADLEALPAETKGEILDGVLYTMPRPRALHQRIGKQIARKLSDPYEDGLGGPGGWWILPEPGIEVPGSPEFSPDVGGWRRERMPELPIDTSIMVVPDWICEVHSPSTRRYDRTKKRQFYARIGVEYVWYIDPQNQEVAVSRLGNGHWTELGVYIGDEIIHAEPFEAAHINLAELWTRTLK